MLAALLGFSLRHRRVVLALAGALVLYGLHALGRAHYDVFPEFAPPQADIQTEAPGLSPEQVELLVTQPVENVLRGLPDIASLRSRSLPGLAVITARFRADADPFRARQTVAERLASLAGRLPQTAGAPVLTPLTSSTSTVLAIGLTSGSLGPATLRAAADYTLKPRLLATPGVAKVVVFGGEVRELQIRVDPARLVRHGLALGELRDAVAAVIGARGAGFLETANQRLPVQAGVATVTPAQLAACLLPTRGADLGVLEIPQADAVVKANTGTGLAERSRLVQLGDVARVADGAAPRLGAAAVNGREGVILLVSSQLGANTLEVTRGLEAALGELRPALAAQGIALVPDLFRPAGFIEQALGNVRSSLLAGAALVLIVLWLFLRDWRSAAISAAAIPLSLLAAVAVLERFGFSLNTMTLGGLAIAVGEVVDDAVIDVENILRRLRQNALRPAPEPPARVVLAASLEVRGAVVYATLAVALAFAPVLTLGGLAGRLLAPLAAAYLAALLASLLVALTVTPALCLTVFGRGALENAEPRWLGRLREVYVRALRGVERRPRAVLAGVAGLTLAGLGTLPFCESEFLPELREGHFMVHLAAAEGTSLEESLRLGRRVTEALLALPFVRSVGQQAGRAEGTDDVLGTHYSEFHVALRPLAGEAAERARAELRGALEKFPGAAFAVNPFLTERVEETISGYAAPVAVRLFGEDLAALDAAARAVQATLSRVPGATDVQWQAPPGAPQLAVRLRPEALALWRVSAAEALDTVQAVFRGLPAGQLFERDQPYEAVVRLDPTPGGGGQPDPTALGRAPLRTATGAYVSLDALAEIAPAPGRSAVLREDGRRVQTVTCAVRGRSVEAFVREARARLAAEVKLPPGGYLEFAGEAEAQGAARRDLIVSALLATLGLTLLLAVALGHGNNLALLLLNLPFALAGGALAVFALGGALSLGAMVGFATLFGITLRNAILLLAHCRQLVTVEGLPWNAETAARGAAERLAPILMTALVTGLALLPLALGSGEAGREIEGPMALVILGGLVTSTALNLLVLPALAARYARWNSRPAGKPSTYWTLGMNEASDPENRYGQRDPEARN